MRGTNPLPPEVVVATTNEGCGGAGTITCQLLDPAGTDAQFKVYLLPNVTTPVATLTTSLNIVSVTSGEYKIVTTEMVDGELVTYDAVNVTISNTYENLDFDIVHTDAHCNDGTMSVYVTSGVGDSYEYQIVGLTPVQTTNVFTGLAGGSYDVWVKDACGVIKVKTHTVPVNTVELVINQVSFPDIILPSCETITVENPIVPSQSGDDIFYPLTVKYIIHPPNNAAPITVNSSIPAGNPESTKATTVIPFYYDTAYSFDIIITDSCGNEFTLDYNIVNEELRVGFVNEIADCGEHFFSLTPNKFVPPYTVQFTDVPDGFDPVAFNPAHPGPFTGESAVYGSDTQPAPAGDYTYIITDSCGHSTEPTTQPITETDLPASYTAIPHPGCGANMSDIEVTWPGFLLDSIIITTAPAGHTPGVPDDVSEFIDPDQTKAFIIDLVAGDYILLLTSTCGNEIELPVHVSSLEDNLSVTVSTRVDCELGKGGIRVRGLTTKLVSGIMTAANPPFSQPLPFDVTEYITETGTFSMGALPAGDYSFTFIDECNITHIANNKVVPGYAVTSSDIIINKYCLSFDVDLAHLAVPTPFGQKFWLQKLIDEDTNAWGHPGTNTAYAEGTPPNEQNSIKLENNELNINLDYLGKFRILKTFEAFENGNLEPSVDFKICIELLKEFDNDGTVDIVDVHKLTCDGALSTIQIIADGVPPFTYQITEKDGQPFAVDNGGNDTFTDLQPGVYKFTVQHACGHTAVYISDIASLPSLVEAFAPEPILYECENASDNGMATFDLSQQDDDILGTQDPSLYTVSYYASANDAATGDNPLPDNYETESAEIFGRISFNGSSNCYDTASFQVVVNPFPAANIETMYGICPGGEGADIEATPGYDTYLWSTGETTSSIHVDQPGAYTLQITQDYGTGICTSAYSFAVVPAVAPSEFTVDVTDWTDNDNTLTVNLAEGADPASFVYSIDGQNYQESHIFSGLSMGTYTVYVKDVLGCSEKQLDVYILMYPKYFTPNADGSHDYWKVKMDYLEPNLKTYIFDRYGKLITGFGTDSNGWDGFYHNQPLPSTDYWFLVVRENGKEMRGHFAMKR